MRAVRFTAFGGPSVLEITDATEPMPRPGHVTVDVRYAGVNFAEVMFRRGQFPVDLPHSPARGRRYRTGARREQPTGLSVGEPVAALTLGGGGNAEIAEAPAERWCPERSPGRPR